MAAHLPLPIRPNQNQVELVDFATPVQYCVKQSRKYEIVATVLKVVGLLGSTIILFVLGFWTPAEGASQKNMTIMYINKVLALLVSVASSLNYSFDLQRKANKYDSARRAITELEATYNLSAKERIQDKNYLKKLEVWARNNISVIERLLNNEKVYDVETHFEMQDVPT